MKTILKDKIGLLFCIGSLVFYCLLKLPFNLSVLCAGENEGFYFVYGQNFLLWNNLAVGRGPLFVLLYAVVLKIFGFNTWSIIIIHLIQTLVVVLIGTLIYLIIRIVLKDTIFAGLSVLLWIVMIITPIGYSPLVQEIQSHITLEAEYFCILFSLCSIFCLLLSNFVNSDQYKVLKNSERFLLFLAGVFSVCPTMFKASGAFFLIALTVWLALGFIFKRKNIKPLINKVSYLAFGIMFSLLLFQFFILIGSNNPLSYLKDYFLIGSYSQDYLASPKSFLTSVVDFMFRYTSSFSNFILFFFAFLLFIWGLFRGYLIKDNEWLFWSLISIWGICSIFAVIVPGKYEPYYYLLVWPSMVLILTLGLRDLFSFLRELNKKLITIGAILLITIFFVQRILLTFPAYCELTRDLNKVSVFNQVQSFQDPVILYTPNLSQRPSLLKLADAINILLPDKKSTFYVLNLWEKGLTCFSALSYIYAKRYPPTNILSNSLHFKPLFENKLKILKEDLIKRPPDILVISKDIYVSPWQREALEPFLSWFSNFSEENYIFSTTLGCQFVQDDRSEIFLVHERKK